MATKTASVTTVRTVTDRLRPRFVGTPDGNRQRLHCPFEVNHKHGDRNPSAVLNLATGWLDCYVCGSFSPSTVLEATGGAIRPAPVRRSAVRRAATPKATRPTGNLGDVYARLSPAPVPAATERGLSAGVQRWFGLRGGNGTDVPAGAIAIPYFDGGKCIGIKYRTTDPSRRYAAVTGSTFDVPFGGWLLSDEYPNATLAIVEGELNAAALYQAAGCWLDVVSVGSQQPTPALLDRLATVVTKYDYAHVVVWADEQAKARAIAERVAGGGVRVVEIATTVEGGTKHDANEILRRAGETGVLNFLAKAGVLPATLTDERFVAEWRRLVESQRQSQQC